jgi:prophage regulatory protein
VSITFQRIPETLRVSGKSHSALYRAMSDGTFTPPVKIGAKSAAHPVHEVNAILGAELNGATPEQLRKLVADLLKQRKALMPAALREAEAA